MKKIYLLAFALGAFSFASNAQVELSDDFESYTTGDISAQSPNWRTWSGVEGGAEDADVTDDESNSGLQSMLVGGNTITDQILLVPSAPTAGMYTIQFHAFIAEGKGGYFNMQAALSAPGSAWTQALMGGNIFFNCDGASGGIGTIDQSPAGQECTISGASFSYPEDQWFKVNCVYNIDAQTWDMYIDDVQYFFAYPFAFNTQVFEELAGLDFFSATPHNEMYIDDIVMGSSLGVDDFTANNFSVYPNPVTDILNISSKSAVDNVTVYDILGKVVLTAQPSAISPKIDMSSLSAGAYMVQVTIGKTSKTVKVLK